MNMYFHNLYQLFFPIFSFLFVLTISVYTIFIRANRGTGMSRPLILRNDQRKAEFGIWPTETGRTTISFHTANNLGIP